MIVLSVNVDGRTIKSTVVSHRTSLLPTFVDPQRSCCCGLNAELTARQDRKC